MDSINFRELRYQANPELVIRKCLDSAADPQEEIQSVIFVLTSIGLKKMADQVYEACLKYGIDIPAVVMETKYNIS